jgi:hypothetical protein
VGTGVARDTVTNADGIYSVPALVAGTYNIKAELSGFAPLVKSNIVLVIGATLTADLQLGLAGIEENLTVTGQAPLVETSQSVIAASILQSEVQQLPMLNRSMSAMMTLLPGAREVPGTTSAHGFSSSFVSFGGSNGRNYNMLVDGTDNKEDNCGGTFVVYSLEGVQEFKTLTTGANAEYGRGSATVLVATKSGGNQLHGTAFGYGRDEKLIATDYFSDLPTAAMASSHSAARSTAVRWAGRSSRTGRGSSDRTSASPRPSPCRVRLPPSTSCSTWCRWTSGC